jgi:hypothetical protein
MYCRGIAAELPTFELTIYREAVSTATESATWGDPARLTFFRLGVRGPTD